MAFQTLVIDRHVKINTEGNWLKVTGEGLLETLYIPNISNLVIANPATSISVKLINKLIKYNVKVLFCDDKYNPSSELFPLYSTINTSETINMQINWQQNIKIDIWKRIIIEKLSMQNQVLALVGIDASQTIEDYINQLNETNINTIEATVARLYFMLIYGSTFSRRKNTVINAALNYGYAVILSSINRAICMHGYLTQLGINHHNNQNNFNLSCDIIEPFRAIVDYEALQLEEEEFTVKAKLKMANILNSYIYYGNKKYTVKDAIEIFTYDVIKSLNENKCLIQHLKIIQ